MMPKAVQEPIVLSEDEAKALASFIIKHRAEWEDVAFSGYLATAEAEDLELKLNQRQRGETSSED
jgi:hypothetical protein